MRGNQATTPPFGLPPEAQPVAFFVSEGGQSTRPTVKSVYPYSGISYGILMEVADGRIVKVTGDKSYPTNSGRFCTIRQQL